MIATGGLLRINARSRQESLKSRTHKPPGHKRKGKKRSSEVVVVKAKLKLMSLSGVVAALGVLVLLAGLLLAALGYWPRHGLFLSLHPEGGATTTSSMPATSHLQVEGVSGATEQTGSMNGTTGFLAHFLARYLHSDRLKVLGPLVMGVGIFLFICANAVLHEERDRHTRVINLRDVYSTVIDLHRRPGAAPLATPPSHLVNYSQATSLESRTKSFPTSLQRGRTGGGGGGGKHVAAARKRDGGAEGGGGCGDGEREIRQREGRTRGAVTGQVELGTAGGAAGAAGGGSSVFTVYQELLDAPPPSHSLSLLPAGPSPQEEKLRTSSLPRPRPTPPPASCRRHSAGAAAGRAAEQRTCSCSSFHLHQEAPAGSLETLLLLCSSLATPPSVSRRCSLPSTSAVHCKLLNYVTSMHHVTSQRKCSNLELTHKSCDSMPSAGSTSCCWTVGRHGSKEYSAEKETGPTLPLDQSAASVSLSSITGCVPIQGLHPLKCAVEGL